MLYFQVVILAATVMLVYYCEFTDTFNPAQQGFICRDPTLSKPNPGPEQDSRIQPVILYSVVGGLPVVLVSLTDLNIINRSYGCICFNEDNDVTLKRASERHPVMHVKGAISMFYIDFVFVFQVVKLTF